MSGSKIYKPDRNGLGEFQPQSSPAAHRREPADGNGIRRCPSVARPRAGDPAEHRQLSTGRVKTLKSRAGSLTSAKDSRGK